MKQTKWFNLLLAAFLMFGTIFTAPVMAQDEDEPCIAAGTCEDTSGGDEYPEEYVYDEEQGISIIADGNTESRQLITTIDSVDTGAFLQAINGGKITLTTDNTEGTVEIYGAETGIDIYAENSGSSVSVSSGTIDAEALGLGIFAAEGTTVNVTNEEFIGGNNAVDIINDGGTVSVESGMLEAVVGISVQTSAGETTVDTEDINATGYGIVIDVSAEEDAQTGTAPKVTVNVDGNITDELTYQPGEDEPGFEPDIPVEEESASKSADDEDTDTLSPEDEEWWNNAEGWTDDQDEWADNEDWTDDEDWGSGQGWGEDDDESAFSVENSTGVIVYSDISGAEVEVNVSGVISMAYGNEINAENGSSVKVTVGESVETDYGNRIEALEDSAAEFSFGSDVNAGGKAIDTYTDSGTLTVDITGGILAKDSDESDLETVGIYTNSEGRGETKITVGEGIQVSSEEEGYIAYGIEAANAGGNVTVDVDKDMTVKGKDAVGILLINDPEESAFGEDEEDADDPEGSEDPGLPPVTKITINGTVTADAPDGGTGAEIWNQDGKTDLLIYGDLTGSEYGLDVSAFGTDRNSSFADILVTGTVSGKQAGLLVNDEADSDGTEDDNLNLTAWKVTPSSDGVVAGNEDGTANDKVEKNIKYIIKIAEGQEDKIKATDESGNELPVSHGYYYAKEGEKVYLEALNSYDLTEAYNGKDSQVPLTQDESGRFFLDVPKGGAVWLSAEKNPKPQPEPDEQQEPIHFYGLDALSWLDDAQLPGTGFSASHITKLPARLQGSSYGSTGMTLQIPNLGIAEPIVIVPEENGTYPVAWLDRSIGLLEQSSLPGEGITVLTGHNHLNTTEAGPFLFIREMEPNDRILITDAGDSMLIYKVYGNYKIASDGFSEIADAVRENALVLITCEDESISGGYLNRRVILAEPL